MKIMTCPLHGPRNISEFVYGGQVKVMPDYQNVSDTDWAHHVFYEKNDVGIVLEWWMHSPRSLWFIAERHNATDEIIRTYPADQLFKQRVDFVANEGES